MNNFVTENTISFEKQTKSKDFLITKDYTYTGNTMNT